MPRLNLYDMDYDDYDAPTIEPIRRDYDPVNSHHDMLRRTENKMNRERREQRRGKEKNQ